jgi:hypothetical protein
MVIGLETTRSESVFSEVEVCFCEDRFLVRPTTEKAAASRRTPKWRRERPASESRPYGGEVCIERDFRLTGELRDGK